MLLNERRSGETMIARRQLIGMTAGLAFAGTASAQTAWPTRALKLIVTFPPEDGIPTVTFGNQFALTILA